MYPTFTYSPLNPTSTDNITITYTYPSYTYLSTETYYFGYAID